MDVLGIDISKADFHVCLLQSERKNAHSFSNNKAGYQQLDRWLRDRGVSEVHACMEATGGYWMALASWLAKGVARVSVVNPARTSMYSRMQLRRTKTDKVDAHMIAQFCQTQNPPAWIPPTPQVLDLRALLNYRGQLVKQRTELKQIARDLHQNLDLQSLHAAHLKNLSATIIAVESQIKTSLKANDYLKERVACLQSVDGIGWITSVIIVAKLPVQQLRNGKAAASHIGLAPRDKLSGTSVHGKVRICKTGDAELRCALYMPALSAMRCNPILKAFAAGLRERGKPEKVIIVAVMRKLAVLAYKLLTALDAPKTAPAT